jgi:hypothetical protein
MMLQKLFSILIFSFENYYFHAKKQGHDNRRAFLPTAGAG